MLPQEAKCPTESEADECANGGCFHDNPHERPEPPSGIEAPNAAHDEEPVLSAAHERREDACRDRESGGKIVAPSTIIRLGAPRSG